MYILPLQAEQTGLHLKSARKTSKFPGRSNDSMAWHNDRYWISSVSLAYRPCRTRVSQLRCKLSVAYRSAKRYGQQRRPHVFLKTSASHVERNGECSPPPAKVFVELSFRLDENRMSPILDHLAQAHTTRTVIFPQNCNKPIAARDQLQLSDGRLNRFVSETQSLVLRAKG
jgi:hypothetical protein